MTSSIPVATASATDTDATEQPRCPNCREPLLGEFCYACGQPKKGFIRHLSGIIGDFLDTVFNIDSRTLRTVLPLYFKPGFLSLEYFEGRRVRYVTPLRLYFFFSVLAFLAVSWISHVDASGDALIQFDGTSQLDDPKKIEQQRKEALAGLEKGRPFMGEQAYEQSSTAINEEFDALLRRASEKAKDKEKNEKGKNENGSVAPEKPEKGESGEDKIDPDDPNPLKISFAGDTPWDPRTDPIKIGWLNDAGNAWLTEQAARVVKNARIVKEDPDRFLQQVFRLAPQTLFVMLPLFALMLKCFYIFKRRLYMEHLIVALHSHSFLCLSILVLVGLNSLSAQIAATSAWQNLIGALLFAISWWIPIYLLIAQKRIYKQGWFMTLIKYGIIGTCYTVLLSFGIVFNMILSLASL